MVNTCSEAVERKFTRNEYASLSLCYVSSHPDYRLSSKTISFFQSRNSQAALRTYPKTHNVCSNGLLVVYLQNIGLGLLWFANSVVDYHIPAVIPLALYLSAY